MSKSSAASRPSSAGSDPPPPANALFAAFERRLVPLMQALGDLPFVAAVREALPWSFIALAAALIAIFALSPPPSGDAARSLGLRIATALLPAFGFMAGALVVVLCVFLARRAVAPLAPLLIAAVGGFALALPRPGGLDLVDYMRQLGTGGLFLAILACGVPCAWMALLRRFISARDAAWAGALLALGTFGTLWALHVSLVAGIDAALLPVSRLGDTYAALLIIIGIEMVLWTAGVHGPAVLAAIVTPVYLTMQMHNTQAYSAHQPLPYIVVVSLFLFIFPGGAGATFPLAVMLALSRVPKLRRIGRVSLVPAIFNINEPLLFGAPVVFNPYLAVPFIVAPLVVGTITYAAVAWGLIGRAAFYVPSTIPTFVGTYLATQDLRAPVLVCVNLAVAAAIYYPFVRAYERHVASAAAQAESAA
jgi:cellobiose-specific phosphotransferase system component IIC